MSLLNITKKICDENNIIPKRSKGQNFLITESVYKNIIKTADLKKGDTVLEVGPGLGFLTERLAKQVNKVIAVELDDKLCNILKSRLEEKKIKNVQVINEDILKRLTSHDLRLTSNKTVANLPYNISSVFLRYILSRPDKPNMLVLMLQKEVAERIVAKPPGMSLLSVSVQFYANAEIIEYVGKENFWPEPKVDSAIIKIIPHNNVETHCSASQDRVNEKLFFRLVKHGFSSKRKMLKNNLSAGIKIDAEIVKKVLKKTEIEEKARAQELGLDQWLKLFDNIEEFML